MLDDLHRAFSFAARNPEYANVEGSVAFADGLLYLEIFRAAPVFIFRDCEEFTFENLFYFWENILPFLLHFFYPYLLLPLLLNLLYRIDVFLDLFCFLLEFSRLVLYRYLLFMYY